MKRTTLRRWRQRGASLTELALVMPILAMLLLGLGDLARLLMLRQELSDLSREAGNLVSRGGSVSDAITMSTDAIATFGTPSESGIVVSRVTRRNAGDSTPWIVEQTANGSLASDGTVGTLNGPAQLPSIASLAPGVTLMVVELIHGFHPMFGVGGQRFYPSRVRELAVF